MNAAQVIALARDLRWRIVTAESCTGGLLAGAITDIAGSSDVFDRGFVTYSNVSKTQMLGVSGVTIATYGAVSEQVAQEMAKGALVHANADLAVSITGIAGPGGSEHKPEGRVCFGLALQGSSSKAETIEFGALGRENVRQKAVEHALQLMKIALTGA